MLTSKLRLTKQSSYEFLLMHISLLSKLNSQGKKKRARARTEIFVFRKQNEEPKWVGNSAMPQSSL
jgi:hypothetical protein